MSKPSSTLPTSPPLTEVTLQADLRCDGRHHARVIGLDTTDRDQGVGVGGNRIRDDIFELPQLVASESQPRIAVLALGIKLNFAPEMCGKPRELFDVGRSEGERIALEFLQHW